MQWLIFLTLTLFATHVVSNKLKRSTVVGDCHSRHVDVILVLPNPHSPEVDQVQTNFGESLLNVLLANGEERLTRVKLALISLNFGKNGLDAKIGFDLTVLKTKTEAQRVLKMRSLLQGVKFQGFPTPVSERDPLGIRRSAKLLVAILLYNVTDDAIHSALEWNVLYKPDYYDRPKPTLMLFTDSETFQLSPQEKSLGVQVRDVPPEDTSWSLGTLDWFVCEDDRPKPTLMLFTDSETFQLSPQEKSLGVQVRDVPPEDTSWSLGTLDWFVCEDTCPGSQFSSYDGASCYQLSPPSGKYLAWSIAELMCTDGTTLATLERPEEYDDLADKIQYILKSEHSAVSPDTILPTTVFINLRREATSFASHFHWAFKRPLTYSRWNDENVLTRIEFHHENCAVWRFAPKPQSNASVGVTHGWEQVGCAVPLQGRVLCESSIEGQSAGVVSLRMTPLREDNREHDQLLSMGNFVHVKASSENGRVVFLQYMPLVKLVCLLVRCASLTSDIHLPLNRTVKGPTHQNITPLGEMKESDVSLFMFQCHNEFLPYSRVCDEKRDCKDGSDEWNCGALDPMSTTGLNTCLYSKCTHSSRCISLDEYCDLYPDCDSQDGIESLDETSCACYFYKCGSYECVPQPYGQRHCVDFTRSINSRYLPVQSANLYDLLLECVLSCNRNKCIPFIRLNDSVNDCNGPEGHIDETWGRLEIYWCRAEWEGFKIISGWSPRCVLLRDRFREIIGCRNMQHLQNCEYFQCPESYVKCPGAHCIPPFAVNDGIADCPGGEDENADEPLGVKFGLFMCDDSTYIHPELVCDGLAHCADGSDELECRVICDEGFTCLGDAVVAMNHSMFKVLTDLTFMDDRVRFLNLSHVKVPEFFTNYMQDGMRKLLYLFLVNCNITSLEEPPGRFVSTTKDFITLVRLDLSSNLISKISANSILRRMYHLVYLNLSRNALLQSISPVPFRKSLLALEEIDLSWCGLTHLDTNVFDKLQALSKLDLQGTKLTNIDLRFNINLKILDIRIPSLQTVNPESFHNLEEMRAILTLSYRFCCPQILGPSIEPHICSAPKDALSTCSNLLREPTLRGLLWLMGMAALIGNLVVLFYRLLMDKGKKTGLRYFVFHLSLADLAMGVYLLIIASMDAQFKGEYVLHEMAWRSSVGCKIAGFLSTMSSETSAIFIFLITLDRFLVLKFPYGEIRLSPMAIHLCCGFAWLTGFTLALIPLLPPFQHWVIYSTNGMCLGLPLSPKRLPGWLYSVTVFVGFNFVLFMLIAFGQVAIYRTFSQSKSEALNTKVLADRRRLQEIAIAKRLSLIVVSDFFCWFPIGIMGLLALTGHEIGNEAYSWSAVVVLPINSALNPLLYTMGAVREKLAKWQEARRQQKASYYSSSSQGSHVKTAETGCST